MMMPDGNVMNALLMSHELLVLALGLGVLLADLWLPAHAKSTWATLPRSGLAWFSFSALPRSR